MEVRALKSGAKNPRCGAGILPPVTLPSGAALTQIQTAAAAKIKTGQPVQRLNEFILKILSNRRIKTARLNDYSNNMYIDFDDRNGILV